MTFAMTAWDTGLFLSATKKDVGCARSTENEFLTWLIDFSFSFGNFLDFISIYLGVIFTENV